MNDTTNDFQGSVSASGATIRLSDRNNIVLANIDAAGNLEVIAVGTITDGAQTSAGGDINVAGGTSLSSTGGSNIVLDDATNDFGGSVSASGGTVGLADANNIVLTDIDATGNLNVTAVGAISDGTQTAFGGDIDVAGASTLTSTGGSNIVLNDTTNDFQGSVSASGATIRLSDRNNIVLADIDAAGNLEVIAVGTILDGLQTSAGGDINVQGSTKLTSTGGADILLNDATNNFVRALSASGGTITLSDTNNIVLDDIDASGNLSVTVVGVITDAGPRAAAGGDINVSGNTTLVSTSGANIALNDPTNDFVGSVSASGATIRLSDVNDISLADIDASGNLFIVVVGSIVDDGATAGTGSDVNVGGTAVLSAGGTIVLDDPNHDFVTPGTF